MVIFKRTQCVDLLSSIRVNIVAFLAITVFVMFGAALYSGIGWSGEALIASVAEEQTVGNMADIELIFPYGFDEDDIAELGSADGVGAIEGAYSAFSQFKTNGENCTAKLIMIGHNINRLTQTEGTLPQKSNEIAVEKSWALENGVKIGDAVSFIPDGDKNAHFLHHAAERNFAALSVGEQNEMKYLTNRTFTVTALAESPAYISNEATVYETSPSTHIPASCLMFVPESAFDADSFTGYTTVFIKSTEAERFVSGTDEYNAALEQLKEHILPIAEEMAERKFGELNDALEATGKMLPETAALKELSRAGVTVVMHESNPSMVVLKTVCDLFDTLKYNFSIPFILISLLVSYSTISRTIHKDMSCIGTKKAMGFKNSSIIINYILFAALAAFIGLVSGFFISRFIIERLFLGVLRNTFSFDKMVWHFSVKDTVILSVLQLGFIVLSAYTAGRKTVNMPTIELLSNDPQTDSKEHFFEKKKLWKRLPLLSKIIVINCLNDKRRVTATLIGISGCTALVLCGISFVLSVSNTFHYQFSHLQDYRYVVYFDSTCEDTQDEIGKALAETGAEYSPVLYSTVRLSSPTGKDAVSTLAVSDCDYDGLMKIISLDGKENTLPDSGAWVTCAFAQYYGIDENGGTVTFTDASGNPYTVPCAGVYEFYMLVPRLAMSAKAYEEMIGEKPVPNAFLVSANGMDKTGLEDLFEGIPGFLSVYDYYTVMHAPFEPISLIASAIAALYLVLSVLMALFILLDLFVMFVEEKKRELITLMINGYKLRFAKKYIYCDTIFLTIMGAVLGVIAGILLTNWNLDSVTTDLSYYLHQISFLACVCAAGLSSLLTAVMCLIAMKRISVFQLSDLH